MILVRNLTFLPSESLETLPEKGAKKLRIPRREIRNVRIIRRSLDARRKQEIHYTVSAAFAVRGDEEALLSRVKSRDV